MKRILRRQNLEAALLMAKFAGELEKALVGLGPAVAKEDLSRTDQAGQFFGQQALGLLIVKIGNMDQFFGIAPSAPR